MLSFSSPFWRAFSGDSRGLFLAQLYGGLSLVLAFTSLLVASLDAFTGITRTLLAPSCGLLSRLLIRFLAALRARTVAITSRLAYVLHPECFLGNLRALSCFALLVRSGGPYLSTVGYLRPSGGRLRLWAFYLLFCYCLSLFWRVTLLVALLDLSLSASTEGVGAS